MKTISVSDEDYDTLMELSKELQLQENHDQAFPYFWEPSSERLQHNANDEGAVTTVYDNDDAASYTIEDYAESKPELYIAFLIEQAEILTGEGEEPKYDTELEDDWKDYIRTNRNVEIYSQDWEDKSEHNPSLFMSDVQNFVEYNKHHLGRNPHTYARSVWRMPKMIKLIKAMYRLNPQPMDQVNDEAKCGAFRKE